MAFQPGLVQRSASDRSQRQECSTSGTLLLQKANPLFRSVFIFHNEILHGAAQCGFQRHAVFLVGGDKLCHRAEHPTGLSAVRPKNCLDAAAKALHVPLHILEQFLALALFPECKRRLVPVLSALFQRLHRMGVAFLKTGTLVLHLLEKCLRLLRLFSGGIVDHILTGTRLLQSALPHSLFRQLGFQFFLLSGGSLLHDTQFALPHQQLLQDAIRLFIFLPTPCRLLFQSLPFLFRLFRRHLKRLTFLPQLHGLFRQGCHPALHAPGLFCRLRFLTVQTFQHLTAVENVVLAHCHRRPELCRLFFRLLDLLTDLFHFQRAFLHPAIAFLHLGICPLDLPFGVLIFRLCLEIAVRQPGKLFPECRQPSHPERDFQLFLFPGKLHILLCLFRLLPERFHTRFQFHDDILETHQVFLCSIQLALRLLLFIAELGDTCRLLKNIPAVGAFGADDLSDASLSDDGIAVTSHTGIHKEFRHILQTDIFAVDAVLTVTTAVQLSGNTDYSTIGISQFAGLVVDLQRNCRKAHCFPGLCAGENNVLHLVATERLGRLFPQHPAHRIADVALAAAVGSHYGGQTLVKVQLDLIGKGLKAL